ncbi:MAG TPA: ferredoxin [Clostridiales bacterium]|jgi:polyferredoxin|nr:ferredoxin [Clostridiales bacterium]
MKKLSIRSITQVLFFVIVLAVTYSKNATELGLTPIPFIGGVSLHAICPFGGVETFYTFITGQGFINKIHDSTMVMFVLVLAGGVLFGSAFCGFICPLGTIQEWVGKAGKKLFPKHYNQIIPKKWDYKLRYLRYVTLIAVVYFSSMTFKLVFADYDPYFALFNFYAGEVAFTAIVVLAVVLISSLIVERPWCKYLCPFGIIMGLFNKIRIFKIVRNSDTCINCKKCDRVCPMNLIISDKKVVSNTSCISCLACTSENACPIGDTMIMKLGGVSK